MADQMPISGILVAVTERAYKAFTDRQGESRPGGVTYRMYLTVAFDQAPVEVKVPSPVDFGELKAAGLGSKVACQASLFAKAVGGQAFIERSVVENTLDVQSVAANGKRQTAAA